MLMKIMCKNDDSMNVVRSRGFIWFFGLNILFCGWFMLRAHQQIAGYITSPYLQTLFSCIIIVSILNIVLSAWSRRHEAGWLHLSTFVIVSLQGGLWAGVFHELVMFYTSPAIPLVLLVLILLPATVSLYISTSLLVVFTAPIVISVAISEVMAFDASDITHAFGVVLALFMILSSRYILLEWYRRMQRSEQETQLLIRQLTRAAHNDSLTGLKNRRGLKAGFALLQRQLLPGEKMSILVMDIDFFKQYNDIYGHIAGDECLLKVAGCIRHSIRAGSDIACRFGGEEFAVLTVGEDESHPVLLAERIRSVLATVAMQHAGSSIADSVTLSVGIAGGGRHVPLETLYAQADLALYRAKRAGRNRVVVWTLP